MTDLRFQSLYTWLKSIFTAEFEISPLTGDASFRRYFRIFSEEKTYIAADAPPDRENSSPFVAIARVFSAQGIHVPQIFACDLEHGFLLISDFGNDMYQHILNIENADMLYEQALEELLKIQTCPQLTSTSLPHFDELLISTELLNFRTWFLEHHLCMQLNFSEDKLLSHTFKSLVEHATTQPQCCIHRDYHSRNLMLFQNKVGVLDFQDAAWGPITYDAVSLLRDCYISWPAKKVEEWALRFHEMLVKNRLLKAGKEDFLKWFDWMGIQRHLKAIFIFARKYHRDNIADYLQYIPTGLQYVLEVGQFYAELKPFCLWMKNEVLPRYAKVRACSNSLLSWRNTVDDAR